MILYTMMPHELIFPSEPEVESRQKMITYQGVPLIVEQMDQENFQVIRIMSTNPQDYLNEQICPGMKISFANLGGMSALQ